MTPRRIAWLAWLALALVGATAALAADQEPLALKYDQLTLTDGRILTKVTIKSYDAKGEKLLMIADGKAMSLPIALVPDPLAARLKEEAPKSGASTSSTQERKVYAPVTTPGPDGKPRRPLPTLSTDEKIEMHRKTARNVAEMQLVSRYLTGEARKWKVVRAELSDPVPVQGWIDRYRTTGTMTLDLLDASGATVRTITRDVEVVTEKAPNRSSPAILNFADKEPGKE